MKRGRLLCALWLAWVLVGCGEGARRPHIVLLLADDVGWNDAGYHGSEIETPHIDALAASGVRLEQFYVLPACTSTRAALLTGRHPMRYGLQASSVQPHARFGLSLEERTLADALREAGYFTALVGKWHLGHASPALLPRQRGFDHHYGHYNDQIGYFGHTRNGGLDWHRNGEPLREEGYATHLVGAEAERLIRAHDPSTPLFLQVAFLAAHTPLEAPPEAVAHYAHLPRPLRRTFAAMVSEMDTAIGGIVAALTERGMRRDTLVLFASDNGANEAFGGDNAPLRGGKYRVYEGGVRVPALLSWPGTLEAGRRYAHPLHVVDLYPTLLGLAGGSLEQPLPVDGLDAWSAIGRDAPLSRDSFLLNTSPSQSALRAGDWKLLVKHRPSDAVELYDLARDPGETRDVASTHPEVVGDLRPLLRRYQEQAAPPLKPGPVPPDFQAPAVWGAF